ncbi:MAG: hypothetical protein QW051_01670, partial [Candidatus Aenigmatarchaeota archaeon]
KITHYECINMECIEVEGDGENQCIVDDDCYYYGCDYTQNACIKIPGNYQDECSFNWECVFIPPEPPEPEPFISQ